MGYLIISPYKNIKVQINRLKTVELKLENKSLDEMRSKFFFNP